MTRTALMAFAMLFGARAWARPWLVESSAQVDRSTAEQLLDAIGPRSESTGVTRRFERGAGWGFVVRVEGLEDIEVARSLAAQLSSAAGPARIFDQADDKRVLVEIGQAWKGPAPAGAVAEAPPLPAPSSDGRAEPPSRDRSADGVLRAAVKAHGGRKGGLQVLSQAHAIDMRYERTVTLAAGTLVARHHLVREGEAMRLEVTVLQSDGIPGDGVDSVTVLRSPGQAWITADGVSTARDPNRTREILSRFSPEQLLAVPLGIDADVGSTRTWRGLVMADEQPPGLNVLAPGPAHDETGLVDAAFDTRTGTLRRLTWSTEQGQMRFSYGDYRELVPGLVVPFQVDIARDGTPVEQLRISELKLDPVLDAGLFLPPADIQRQSTTR